MTSTARSSWCSASVFTLCPSGSGRAGGCGGAIRRSKASPAARRQMAHRQIGRGLDEGELRREAIRPAPFVVVVGSLASYPTG